MKSKMRTKAAVWETWALTSVVSRPAQKLLVLASLLMLLVSSASRAQDRDFDRPFLPAQVRAVSTIPVNGDLNPYGVAFVPRQFPMGGATDPGDILVSNFNASSNLQGTGTTIIRVPPNAPPSLFFQGTPPLGLTTALNVLKAGFVLVGNFPAGTGACGAEPGSILVINSSGTQVGSITGSYINGPWDSALFDEGSNAKFFVSNALDGTIQRLDLALGPGGVTVKHVTQIASGYTHMCDAVTFVDAPTGLVYDPHNEVLYVASTADNGVYAVPDAGDTNHDHGKGILIYEDNQHLHGPLGMVMAPNGHLIVSNNDAINPDPNQPSELVEFTIEGRFVKQISVDPAQGGAFGLATARFDDWAKLAAVDDNTGILLIWTLPLF